MAKTKPETVDALEEVAAARDLVAPDERSYWRRDTALSHALALHKINGGMKPVNQILADAVVILEFLKGNNDE